MQGASKGAAHARRSRSRRTSMFARPTVVRGAQLRSACLYLSVACAVLTLLGGCPDNDLGALDPCTHAVGRTSVTQVPTHEVDLMFVVDDSRSMEQEQINL